MDNHCGNYRRHAGDCVNDVMKAIVQRNGPSDCGSCNNGYFLSPGHRRVRDSECGGACAERLH